MAARLPRLLGRNGPTAAGYLALAGVVGACVWATHLVAAGSATRAASGPAPPGRAGRPLVAPALARAAAAPSAAEFGMRLTGTANAYAEAHGEPQRLSRPHCVPGNPGHYMCVYLLRRRGHRPECRLVQAEWTPARASSFTITLRGRVPKCGSVRQAIRSI